MPAAGWARHNGNAMLQKGGLTVMRGGLRGTACYHMQSGAFMCDDAPGCQHAAGRRSTVGST